MAHRNIVSDKPNLNEIGPGEHSPFRMACGVACACIRPRGAFRSVIAGTALERAATTLRWP
jgi:hypothetical protein